jgi:hypothetical protein
MSHVNRSALVYVVTIKNWCEVTAHTSSYTTHLNYVTMEMKMTAAWQTFVGLLNTNEQ